MLPKDRKDATNPLYPLERLRKDRIKVFKKDFPALFDLSYGTYKDWVAYDKKPDLSYEQMKKLAEVANMSLDELEEYIDNYTYQKY